MFDLEVLARGKTNLAVFIVIGKISGPINRLQILFVERVLYKCLCGLLRIIIVAQGKRCSGNTDLAIHILLRDQLILVIQQKDLLIGERNSAGENFTALILAVNDKIRAVARDLGRTVKIHEHSLRQSFLPGSQMPDRHDFTGE